MIQMSTPRRANCLLALLAFVVTTTSTALAQTYTILHHFGSVPGDGADLRSELLQVGSKLYGTALSGGTTNIYNSTGYGTVFAMNPDGSGYTNLHIFSGDRINGRFTDGNAPYGGLTMIGANLYGTTMSGGTNNQGIVFAMSTNGANYTILHQFGSVPLDGRWSRATMIHEGSMLYGTTGGGGTTNNGTVFAIKTNGTGYTVLHSFGLGPNDGAWPLASVTLVGSKLYGTTEVGGSYNQGTVFAMNTNGTGYTILRHFAGLSGNDGYNPFAALISAGAMLYGTTMSGGPNNYGTVFAVNTNGTDYTILHSFTDGHAPNAGVTLVGSILCGTTMYGGSYTHVYSGGDGTVFAMSTNGSAYAVLHNFGNVVNDGAFPWAGVTLVGSNLYGTTGSGGSYSKGVVFMLPLPSRIIGLSGNLIFDNIPVGSSAQQMLTITNSGGSDLYVSDISYPSCFSGAWSGTIPAGGSHDLTVTFAPTGATSYGGTVTVNSDATSGTATITASGNGVTPLIDDGIPDWWRDLYFGNGSTTNSQSCATCDPDGDGPSNLQEYLSSTDPTNGVSALRITAVARQGNDISVTWTCVGSKSYVLQHTKSAAIATYTADFADASPVIAVSGVGESTTNYLDAGAAYAPVLTPPGSPIASTGTPSTVNITATTTRGLADFLGGAAPSGSLLMLGAFSISEDTIQSNFYAGNVSAIMSAFTPYSTPFTVGEGTGLPATWDVSRSAAGYGGQQIYLLAVNKPTLPAATHLGIYTAPSWVFPADGDGISIALEDVTDFVVGRNGGPLTISFGLGQTYTFDDTAKLSYLPGRILFYRVRLVP